jgi:RNA polymerase sigma-70 factor (ECF subfamily)
MRPSWPRAIEGRDKVLRLLAGVVEQWRAVGGLRIERAEINGQPGAAVRDENGALLNVFSFEVVDGAVQSIRSVIARDKLRHLGPLADVEALRARMG